MEVPSLVVRFILLAVPVLAAGGALVMIARGLFATAGTTDHSRRRAQRARANYHEVLRHISPGPLHERLTEIGRAVDAAAVEADRVTQIVEATGAAEGSAPARRLDQLVSTLERAVVVAGELAVSGHDESQELDVELDAIDAALRELGDQG